MNGLGSEHRHMTRNHEILDITGRWKSWPTRIHDRLQMYCTLRTSFPTCCGEQLLLAGLTIWAMLCHFLSIRPNSL